MVSRLDGSVMVDAVREASSDYSTLGVYILEQLINA
jgi:hypothetical protein